MEKSEKKKPSYSVFQNLKFVFSNIWKWDKAMLLLCLIRVPIIVILPLLGVYMSKVVVDIVTHQASVERLLLYILIISAAMLVLNLLNNTLSPEIECRAFSNRFKYLNLWNEKNMDADYENIEGSEGQIKQQKAFNIVHNNNSGTQVIINNVIGIVSNVIGIISYGTIISTLNPLIVLLLVATSGLNYYLLRIMRLYDYKNKDHWIPIDRKLDYLQNKSGEFANSKDIRLNSMSAWFIHMYNKILKERTVWYKRYEIRGYLVDIVSGILTFIRDGIAYFYLIFRMLNTSMVVSDFVLYFAIIGGFSGWFSGLINEINALNVTSLSFCDLRDYLDMPDKFNRQIGVALPKETCNIEFRNVSFRYSKSENYTIDNMNVTIKKGEKIAIVGLNGAGKTTFVKLLCGLYRPTEGQIYADGCDITSYNRDEYYKLFSVAFQDIYVMPISIAKNIALCDDEEIDHQGVISVLKLSGLYEKIHSLPKGMDTLLLKSIHEEATELSGGEMQKLALARALYKDGKIIILDEPTAALDPIAENEMYLKYDELTRSCTSIFISHRLSSTRFCDRILFLENGKIVETGTHKELILLNGKYAEMFEIQSHYYKDRGGLQ